MAGESGPADDPRPAGEPGAAGHGAMATAVTPATAAIAVTPPRARAIVLPPTSSRARYVRTVMYAVSSTGAKKNTIGTDCIVRDMGMKKLRPRQTPMLRNPALVPFETAS